MFDTKAAMMILVIEANAQHILICQAQKIYLHLNLQERKFRKPPEDVRTNYGLNSVKRFNRKILEKKKTSSLKSSTGVIIISPLSAEKIVFKNTCIEIILN